MIHGEFPSGPVSHTPFMKSTQDYMTALEKDIQPPEDVAAMVRRAVNKKEGDPISLDDVNQFLEQLVGHGENVGELSEIVEKLKTTYGDAIDWNRIGQTQYRRSSISNQSQSIGPEKDSAPTITVGTKGLRTGKEHPEK